MTAKLSPEIDQAIKAHGSPLEVVSADEQTQYVIISNEQFKLYCRLFDQGGLSSKEQKTILARNGRKAGWDDPEMDAYNNYDDSCPTQ